MIIKNGILVKMVAGDRDRVGDISYVDKIQENGDCEFHGTSDMCHGNILEIGFPGYEPGGRIAYITVDPKDLPTYMEYWYKTYVEKIK